LPWSRLCRPIIARSSVADLLSRRNHRSAPLSTPLSTVSTQSGHSLNSCSKPTNPLAREMSEAEALSHFLWGEVYSWDGVGLMDVYGFI
jgi:hypothetical protein